MMEKVTKSSKLVILKNDIEMGESTDDEQPEDQDCGTHSEQVQEFEADGEPFLKFWKGGVSNFNSFNIYRIFDID